MSLKLVILVAAGGCFLRAFAEITTFTFYNSKVKSTERTKVIFFVHDWNTKDLNKAAEIKEALLKRRNDVKQVAISDWSTFSRSPDFFNVAKRYTKRVAEDLLKQIKHIVDNENVNPSDIELIGHGLGAHIAGSVGKLWNKENKDSKLGKIIGLDPTGPYFKDNRKMSLDKSDAEVVYGIHTDKRYGIYQDIGHNDTYPPTSTFSCNQRRLLKRNECLHKIALDVYLEILQGETTNKNPNDNFLSILTLDVSPSMQEHGRIKNMVTAARRLINELPNGQYVGIVIFGAEAYEALVPTLIDTDETRVEANSKLPETSLQIANTSIGAGLSKAIDMAELWLLSHTSCPDIILVTDGEENTAPLIADIKPRYENKCLKIHTIGLGSDADSGLESISSKTGGKSFSSSDVNSLDQLTQNLLDSSKLQFPKESIPIQLPTKEIEVDSPNATTFTFDENIGSNTTILISIPKNDSSSLLTAELIAPNGDLYGTANYSVDFQGLLFKLLEVQAGNWSIKLNSLGISKRKKRSISNNNKNEKATVMITTYSRDKETEPISLEAYLSTNILTSGGEKLYVEALLSQGEQAIVNAIVLARINFPDGQKKDIDLLDNGVGADETENDGVYSNYISDDLEPGKRYGVIILAKNKGNEETKVLQNAEDPYTIPNLDSAIPVNYDFERQANAGSFRVAFDYIYRASSPLPIKDLKVEELNFDTHQVTLKWTLKEPPVDLLSTLRVFTGAGKRGHQFVMNDVINGNLTIKPSENWKDEHVLVVQVPDELWAEGTKGDPIELYFTMKLENKDFPYSSSDYSNIASADFAIPSEENSQIHEALLITIIVLVTLVLLVIAFTLWAILRRRTNRFNIRTRM